MLFVFLSIACKPDMILVSMYLFMLNKLCLSLSLSLSLITFPVRYYHVVSQISYREVFGKIPRIPKQNAFQQSSMLLKTPNTQMNYLKACKCKTVCGV